MAYGNWRLTFALRDVRNEVSNGEKTKLHGQVILNMQAPVVLDRYSAKSARRLVWCAAEVPGGFHSSAFLQRSAPNCNPSLC
jgi:hypothetical protein